MLGSRTGLEVAQSSSVASGLHATCEPRISLAQRDKQNLAITNVTTLSMASSRRRRSFRGGPVRHAAHLR